MVESVSAAPRRASSTFSSMMSAASRGSAAPAASAAAAQSSAPRSPSSRPLVSDSFRLLPARFLPEEELSSSTIPETSDLQFPESFRDDPVARHLANVINTAHRLPATKSTGKKSKPTSIKKEKK